MTIGINATAAIKQSRTGVEEYCYQIIKHLTMLPEAREHRFLLFVPGGTNLTNIANQRANDTNKIPPNPPLLKGGGKRISPFQKGGLRGIFPPFAKATEGRDFPLPENFKVKRLVWPLPMWTQLRLASHLLFEKPDILFIPVHILPQIHPKNLVVTIHGLEYEYFSEYYPFWFRNYLRWSTKYAVHHARKIIAVSENTKNDLIKRYGEKSEKIEVVHHGIEIPNFDNSPRPPLYKRGGAPSLILREGWGELNRPYLFYIGRIELKKNILGILEAYKILKDKYKIPHELVLAGPPGFGYEKIKFQVESLKFKVHELGYVSEQDKWSLLRHAEVFLFPSFYEGFGMPILEAQAIGVPVVTSNVSSIPEVAGDSVLLVDPKNHEAIAEAVYKLIDDNQLHDKLIELGYENVKRFSWDKCARETLKVLME